MKERVTLTLDGDLLKQVDSSVNGHTIKNRSHAIELLLIKAMGTKRPIKAVILAGGKKVEGSKPLCMRRLNDIPIIEHIVRLFKKYGILDIIISIGPKGKSIKEHFGNGKAAGVNMTYIEEAEPLGTAGPLLLIKDELTKPFIVCNADELKDIDLTDMYSFHKDQKALATVALTTVKDVDKYGMVRMRGVQIIEFIEKPRIDMKSRLINSGLYILSPEIFDYMPASGRCFLEKDVFPKLAEEGKLAGYSYEGMWFDTTTDKGLELASEKWKF